MNIDQLRKRLKKLLDNANPLGDTDSAQAGRQNFWTNTANNALVRTGQSPVGKALVSMQQATPAYKEKGMQGFGIKNFMANGSSIADYVPRFQTKPNATLSSKAATFAANIPVEVASNVIGRGIVDPLLDIGNLANAKRTGTTGKGVNQMKSAPVRLGANIMGEQRSPQQIIGNTAGTFLPALDIYGGGKVLGVGKQVLNTAGKRTFMTLAKQNVKEGAKAGGYYGLLQGLADGKDESLGEQAKRAVATSAMGAGAGGVLSGGITAGVYPLGYAKNKVMSLLTGKYRLSQNEADAVIKEFARDEMGRFINNKAAAKKIPEGFNNKMLDLSEPQVAPVPAQGRMSLARFSPARGRQSQRSQSRITPEMRMDLQRELNLPGDYRTGKVAWGDGDVNAGIDDPTKRIKQLEEQITSSQPKTPEDARQIEQLDEELVRLKDEIMGTNTSGSQQTRGEGMGTQQQKLEGLKQELLSDQPLTSSSKTVGESLPESLNPQGLQSNNQTQSINQQGRTQRESTDQSLEEIIAQGRKEISKQDNTDKRSIRDLADEFYTNWVDRFHPVMKATSIVEGQGKKMGFELRPENNPRFTIRRFLGMNGIAEQRFNDNLAPILDELDSLKIPKDDMDLYLKSRRDINLSERDIKGSDKDVATTRIRALEAKYGESLAPIADKLYSYQREGFEELAKAGFFDNETAQAIINKNVDYVPFMRKIEGELDEYIGMPTKKAMQGTNPINAIKGSDKQIYSPLDSIIANTFKQRAAIEKNNVAKSIANLSNIYEGVGFKPSSKGGESTITYWENGKKRYMDVGEDIARSVKGMNEEQMNSVLKVLTLPARVLRSGATGMNPEFMIPNAFRDQFDAAINSKYGYIPFLDYVRGVGHLLKEDLGGGDELVRSWMRSGGSQSFSRLSGRKTIQEATSDAVRKKRIFDWAGDTLGVMGRYSEMPTRIGLYGKALKKTGNPTLAAYESREGTMDFSRMGAKMKVANSLIPFLNVGVQGFDKLLRNAKDNPAKLSALMGLYAVTPTLAITSYNLLNHPEEYAEVPQYIKDGNFVIVTGRNEKGTVDYITLPKGHVLATIANPLEGLISYATATNEQSVPEMLTNFISSTLPVVGDGQSLKEVGIKTLGSNLPQAIKPTMENLINRSFFKYDTNKEEAKDIVPFYLKDKAPADQAYKFTPEMYKKIGTVLNVSPLQVQNFLEGHFAGFTKIPAQVIDMLVKTGDGEEVNKNNIPLLRRFIQETYETGPKKTTKENHERKPLFSFASASGSKDKPVEELSWYDEEGDRQSVTLTSEVNTKSGIDAFDKENSNASKARKIYQAPDDELSREEKIKAYRQMGFSEEDVRYDYMSSSKFTNEERTDYIKSLNLSKEQLMERLLTGRRESIDGNLFIQNGVLDNLAAEDIITYEEAGRLKKIKFDKEGADISKGSKGKGGKGRKFQLKKASDLGIRAINAKSSPFTFKPIQLKKMQMKSQGSRVKSLNLKPITLT